MFVLELSYTAPLEAVDAVLPDHVAWLDELYERGVVLASGRKEPRDGGVIVAVAGDRARMEEIARGRPVRPGRRVRVPRHRVRRHEDRAGARPVPGVRLLGFLGPVRHSAAGGTAHLPRARRSSPLFMPERPCTPRRLASS